MDWTTKEGKDIYLERLEDLSFYYFLKDKFSSTPFVNIEDGFPEKTLQLPTVAIEAGKIDVREYELGNRDGIRVRRWYIEIYAKNKSQRDEFGYLLLNELKNGVPVYNYNEGFPPDITPTKIGALQVLAKSYEPIRVSSDVVEKMQYRAIMTIIAQNDVIQEV